uniref:Uncharacterized protein n=1 Tax=viral metagenome TaxID=1070528 RepID=A0A6C0JD05_9ZZZZ|tara:strand:- start:495 stop:704 length:210 start_codon:yes stop_codon:yes gene_type:complete
MARKSRSKSRKSRKSRKSSKGGSGLVLALRTALLPFLLYKGQKKQQKRVLRSKTKRKGVKKKKKSRGKR